jgi:hypothetical protein
VSIAGLNAARGATVLLIATNSIRMIFSSAQFWECPINLIQTGWVWSGGTTFFVETRASCDGKERFFKLHIEALMEHRIKLYGKNNVTDFDRRQLSEGENFGTTI